MADAALNFVFRVDSGVQMGSGHVMRCLTLARELSGNGARIQFICRDIRGNLIDRIQREGYVVYRLPAPQEQRASSCPWLQVPLHQDAEETRTVLERVRPAWLVVDHYGISAEWHRAQRGPAKSIFVVDDLADRALDCDLLLDQSYVGRATLQRYVGLVPDGCRTLLGPRYALLSSEYAALHEALVERTGDACRVLVFFGGTDATDETSKALQALARPELAHLAVDVVLGANHPAPERVEAMAQGRPRTTLHRNLPTLAGLMFRADLAIGAGGTVSWERLCLGLPSIVITVAVNQEAQTSSLADEGLARWLGRAPEVTADSIFSAVQESLHTPLKRPWLVDGHGVDRVTAALVSPSRTLRLERAGVAHAELLYHWRNDPQARAMSFNDGPIEWDAHVNWYRAQLADPRVQIFIGRSGRLPVGQVRLDGRASQAVLSYSVDADVRGLGFGSALVERAVRSAGHVPAAGYIANVKAGNMASRRVFQKLGWRETAAGGDCVFRLDAAASPQDVR